MMNYEIALKLKNSRFPQQTYPNSQYYIAPNVIIERKDIFQYLYHDNPKEARTSNEFVFKPTLEDLIEALGDRVGTIYHNVRKDNYELDWSVATYAPDCAAHGNSPIEAVANLYLKLHEQM